MKKNFLKISAAILLSINLVGCGAKQSTENKQAEQKTEAVEGPGKDFDWNAKVAPVGKKNVLILRKILEKVLLQILLN